MRRFWRTLMALGLLAGLVPLLPVGVAVADDAVVAAPCGEAEFDAALATALTNGGGTITFNCGGPATIFFTAQKVITSGNSIIIDGADQITLDGSELTRHFLVESGATLEIRNLTLQNGEVDGDGGAIYAESGSTLTIRNSLLQWNDAINFGDGGAIWSDATLTIESSILRENSAADGGSIDNDGAGSTTITDSEFIDNEAADGDGGAIDNEVTLNVTNTLFSSNQAYDDGGAIWTDDSTVTITDSEFISNSTEDDDGGALVVSSDSVSTTISNTTFTDNAAYSDGGAIGMYGGTLEITGSSFEGNEADDGGAIDPDGGSTTIIESSFVGNYAEDDGGAIDYDDPPSEDDSLTIIRSTFYDNYADEDGGALHLDGTLATIESSTITGNETDDDDGGGIYSGDSDGEVFIYNSTITDNEADDDGGGIYVSEGMLTIVNTIVAGNDDEDCDGAVISGGYNLDSDDTCDLDQPTDIPDGDADLSALADNGGPTMTHLPMETSDAIANGGLCSGTDQRLRPRPVEGCEIGSVELQTAATYALCVDYYTGRVLSPLNGQCAARTFELDVPEIYPTAFCIDRWTSILSYTGGQGCTGQRQVHLMPDYGDLLTCVNYYTTINRVVRDHADCRSNEAANLIPGSL